VGQRLHNFALNDINGQPWEYRKDRRGRLVLLDFWGTWCVPCQYAVRHLVGMQQSYGPFGLEIIGIAYESGPAPEQARKVRGVAQRLGVNYRMLLGTGREVDCPVRTQFEVRYFPTLVLIDDKGQILWRNRSDESPDDQWHELERLIKQRLGVR
jgi:thiol-disulfide isomerase/thioredoxin